MTLTKPVDLTIEQRPTAPPVGAAMILTGVLSVASVVLAVLGVVAQATVGWWIGAVVVLAWAVSAVAVGRRVPRLGLALALVALATGAALAVGGAYESDPTDGLAQVRSVMFALVPVSAVNLALSLPDGRLRTPLRRATNVLFLIGSLVFGAVVGSAHDLPTFSYAVQAAIGTGLAVGFYARRCRTASAVDRARLQWMGWGVVVTATSAGVVALLNWLVDVPRSPGVWALALTVIVPLGFLLSTIPALLRVVDRVLVQTTVVVGLVALVAAIYLLVVVGLGRIPEDGERTVLVLSMIAAALAALLSFPARRRLEELANQRIYGERTAPEEALKTFAGRMSRAVPMDELLLQLVENLRKTMQLTSAEVWTGSSGVLERTVSVPDRPITRIALSGDELTVVARAKVQGNAWLAVWIPNLVEEAGRDKQLRVASIAHLGDLLGLIVVERRSSDSSFSEDEDSVLMDLARQVGLALHNVRLDSALQESLDELKVRNDELQASRLRIVTASDESRRRIERNLHDGAQQHLVAMAVKLGLARQLVDADPATAAGLMEELRSDVQDTLGELRELAHGIYPPLLRDRGLAEALRAAANRSVLPVELDAADVDRYSTEAEAAIYFCCLEALQNAGKYAGEEARVTLTVSGDEHELRFEVVDDGPGFDVAVTPAGHGFENMRDRLGAIGGDLVVTSAPGQGTTIAGQIPAVPLSLLGT